ncbi:hypothetical protein MVES1_003813 [Malassezia vespertilionis]|uniref:T-cell immunomodulatory protein TIP C2 domain-containing protein n=1 Tax=Malassezia vespertilionis TaxID=2020962 RepID=A0A2N1J7V2_9BASI|nr:uncharacterized protein MVES1_003813 [Malassezia vespertilionis]PKI82542.1 hypothetical protein MVES_003370 [Malassezia vespertilionis]WFD08437.1 hypothetical protein MVES1_003813 [Malassezia vespertilionis]
MHCRWLVALALAVPAHALFGFGSRRATDGFVGAGALGLEGIDGTVAAWGYMNDDRFVDALVVHRDRSRVQVHEWVAASFAFNSTPSVSLTVPRGLQVVNVVPGDFMYNGRADLLVMAEAADTPGALKLLLWPSRMDGSFDEAIELPSSMHAQPLVADTTGDMHLDLVGHALGVEGLSIWENQVSDNTSAAFALTTPVLEHSVNPLPGCELADPHSSAFVDMNGDCLADLFLVCKDKLSGQLAYQIWTADKEKPKTYSFARGGFLPKGTGALSFADMNRDGTMDVVFPTCQGGKCQINIAYNQQLPLCATERDAFGGWTPPPGGARACRDPSRLCTADDTFALDFRTEHNDLLARIDLEAVVGDAQLLLQDELSPLHTPVSLRIGDYNKDGYPDILLLTVPKGAPQGATRVHLLESVSCKSAAHPGCTAKDARAPEHRSMRRLPHTVLDNVEFARSAAFIDLGEDGALDVMIQSLQGAQIRGSLSRAVHFVRNTYYDDAFFLKTLTLNGACAGRCTQPDAPSFAAWGSAQCGASYKFTVLDPNGVRRAQQVAQQPQSAYMALQQPAALFGLGRTNNYVELLFVGSTRRQPFPYVAMEGVIPNSELVVAPAQQGPVAFPPESWHRELFLHPGDWVPSVTAVLAGVIALLGAIVFALDLHEQREDQQERKRAVHAINFDAL